MISLFRQTQLLSRTGSNGSGLTVSVDLHWLVTAQVADAWNEWRQAADALMAFEQEWQRSEQSGLNRRSSWSSSPLISRPGQQRLDQDQDAPFMV